MYCYPPPHLRLWPGIALVVYAGIALAASCRYDTKTTRELDVRWLVMHFNAHLSCTSFAMTGLCSSGITDRGGCFDAKRSSSISRNLTISVMGMLGNAASEETSIFARTLHSLRHLLERKRFLLEDEFSILQFNQGWSVRFIYAS